MTLVSFFNELEKKINYALRPLLDHGFQEENALEGIHVKGQTLSHGFQEIFTRWKNNTLEGIHVEGRDRGREIRL
jgi:hypothetical protein